MGVKNQRQGKSEKEDKVTVAGWTEMLSQMQAFIVSTLAVQKAVKRELQSRSVIDGAKAARQAPLNVSPLNPPTHTG